MMAEPEVHRQPSWFTTRRSLQEILDHHTTLDQYKEELLGGPKDSESSVVLRHAFMCNECAEEWEEHINRTRREFDTSIAIVDAVTVPDGRLTAALRPFNWALGCFELVEASGLTGWLKIGITQGLKHGNNLTCGWITFFGEGEKDQLAPEGSDDCRFPMKQALAKYFSGVGYAWRHKFDPELSQGGIQELTTGPSPRSRVWQGVSFPTVAGPGLGYCSYSYGGFSNLGAQGELKLWQQQDNLIKGSLEYDGEPSFFFTAYRAGDLRPRTNCTYLKGELVKKEASLDDEDETSWFWRDRAPDRPEEALQEWQLASSVKPRRSKRNQQNKTESR